jgi:uncharacterized phage protein (TIGR01671 family)
MEDRYLFKAKRLDNGEWVTGSLITCEDGTCKIAIRYLDDSANIAILICAYDVDRDTICQCTGLKDKNGKLIWENDIMKYQWDGKTKIDVVKYESLMFSYKNVIRWSLYQDEVIGNIFDNPELLESEE